ncbi:MULTISPECIES: DegV family protein [Romboutsia]|uniref:DegV domain-containing protein TTE1491 n=1 Tax=Romboutsia hominis TaxID=1507512 RepID=A0A2P2BUK6_9FIRM|nr:MULTISPECIES: DegV family protein [Romboutsia]MCH1959145.1 DegV family protein [Romboutsia hominis]MCH1968265.1 DegV family protein [Romboutsia hominis]MDB8789510.1 DegV family protein [Romboutsia sp. 1001216sp1]MDB8802653.1 DegV family protein [Romboutsia sp. 1001216sp1]MDB8805473.1 DegV family protein [Romboutsia sp. 1001216sp1]
MKDIKIICDSLSDIPNELIEKYDIEVVPLTVILNEKEYKDGVDISNDEFYKTLREENVYPKTSQATYAQFKEVFEKYVNQGKRVLYIAGSSVATGTYQSAVMAKNDTDGEIYTYDSQAFSYVIGILVVEAARMASEGYDIDEIMKAIEELRDKTYVLFSVDTLEYLQKGGRISSTKAAIGSILNIKPILDIKNGLVAPVCQVRGKKNVISKMIELVKDNCGENLQDQTICIGYSDDFKERERLTEAVKAEFNPKDILYFQIGSCVGSHAGPGLTGIVCIKNK